LFYNLHGTTAWFACVVVYVDRTEGFSLSNLIQMWRQTLNQGAFRRKLMHSAETGCKRFCDKEYIAL
ncbi:hypothetical protein T09_6410, partial [Trichinella sp. T9]